MQNPSNMSAYSYDDCEHKETEFRLVPSVQYYTHTTTEMRAFYTHNNMPLFPPLACSLESRWGTHSLFERVLSRHIFHYMLYDASIHTLPTMSIQGNLPVVQYLMEQDIAPPSHKDTALHLAAELGHLDIVQYLVAHGANISSCKYEALRKAATAGHVDIVKHLVEHCPLLEPPAVNMTVRWAATGGQEKHLEIIQYLVQYKGADVHAEQDIALRWAVDHQPLSINRPIVQYLVEDQKADIHVMHETLLRWACRRGYLDTVQYLVERGADIHMYNEQALEWAASEGHLDVVKYLIEQGADVEAKHLLLLDLVEEHIDVLNYL